MKALFVEKEKELAKCFAKVEEMTHQLKQLQHAPPPNGRKNDLEHLKRELLVSEMAIRAELFIFFWGGGYFCIVVLILRAHSCVFQ